MEHESSPLQCDIAQAPFHARSKRIIAQCSVIFWPFRITDANQHGETFCSIEGQVREVEQLSSPIVSVQPQKHVAEGKYASTCSLQKQLPSVARALSDSRQNVCVETSQKLQVVRVCAHKIIGCMSERLKSPRPRDWSIFKASTVAGCNLESPRAGLPCSTSSMMQVGSCDHLKPRKPVLVMVRRAIICLVENPHPTRVVNRSLAFDSSESILHYLVRVGQKNGWAKKRSSFDVSMFLPSNFFAQRS